MLLLIFFIIQWYKRGAAYPAKTRGAEIDENIHCSNNIIINVHENRND